MGAPNCERACDGQRVARKTPSLSDRSAIYRDGDRRASPIGEECPDPIATGLPHCGLWAEQSEDSHGTEPNPPSCHETKPRQCVLRKVHPLQFRRWNWCTRENAKEGGDDLRQKGEDTSRLLRCLRETRLLLETPMREQLHTLPAKVIRRVQ